MCRGWGRTNFTNLLWARSTSETDLITNNVYDFPILGHRQWKSSNTRPLCHIPLNVAIPTLNVVAGVAYQRKAFTLPGRLAPLHVYAPLDSAECKHCRENRTCNLCDKTYLGDELQYLWSCPFFNKTRNIQLPTNDHNTPHNKIIINIDISPPKKIYLGNARYKPKCWTRQFRPKTTNRSSYWTIHSSLPDGRSIATLADVFIYFWYTVFITLHACVIIFMASPP